LKKNKECKCSRNEIDLISINEEQSFLYKGFLNQNQILVEQFIQKIKEVYEQRKIVDVSNSEASDSDNC
jgi:hypothetical protein